MRDLALRLKAYIDAHPFDPGDGNCETVLDQLYQAYAESRESDPPEIQAGFAELESFLETLPLNDNNAVFSLCCRLCIHYERKKGTVKIKLFESFSVRYGTVLPLPLPTATL